MFPKAGSTGEGAGDDARDGASAKGSCELREYAPSEYADSEYSEMRERGLAGKDAAERCAGLGAERPVDWSSKVRVADSNLAKYSASFKPPCAGGCFSPYESVMRRDGCDCEPEGAAGEGTLDGSVRSREALERGNRYAGCMVQLLEKQESQLGGDLAL